jgi:hypothetical protein
MPGRADLSERPSFVVLDGRNRFECNEILSIAGVALLGTFVVTCPEEVIATRKAVNDPELNIEQEIQRLRRRNTDDRSRGLGPMTLPQDIEMPFNADMLLDFPGEQAWRLAYTGNASRQNPEDSGVIFRTDKMTLDDELHAAKGILRGMFQSITK